MSRTARWRAAAMLAALLLAVGLATSRLGLLGHELVGHAGAALATGGRVVAVGLFWFAGGWIRYRIPGAELSDLLIVALAGIALEAIVGAALWLGLARREQTLGVAIARAVGAALVVHAAWYLATGTWHGYGDGALLRRVLGDPARHAIAIGAGGIAVAVACAGARRIFGHLVATLPGHGASRIALLAGALAIAGGVQAGLVVGELAIRRDVTYGVIMQAEETRIVARELQRWQAEQAQRGVRVDDTTRAARQRQLAARHREWPFRWVLGALLAVAIVAGAARSPAHPPLAIERRLLIRAWLLAIGSLTLVIVLGARLGV